MTSITRYKYETVLGEQVIAEDREDCSFIGIIIMTRKNKSMSMKLTLFVKCRQEEDLYRKYQEVHFQRAYTLEEIKTLIEKSGLTFSMPMMIIRERLRPKKVRES